MNKEFYSNQVKEEFINYFKQFDIDIEFKNNWLVLNKENPIELLKELWKNIFEEKDILTYSNEIVFFTLNDFDLIRTNLVIKIGYETNRILTFREINIIRQWFENKNIEFNNRYCAAQKLDENFKPVLEYRPTFILNGFRVNINQNQYYLTMKPAKDNSREIIYNFEKFILRFNYIWNKEFETYQLFRDDILELEEKSNNQDINFTKELLNSFVNKSNDIIKEFIDSKE